MEFEYLQPAPTIAPAVKAVWIARGSRDEFDQPDPIVPDGCVEIVLNLGDPFFQESGGQRVVQPRDLLVGQAISPTTARPTGQVDLIGIRLKTSRAAIALSTPMHELTGRMVCLSDIWPGADRWLDHLRDRPREHRLNIVTDRISKRLSGADVSRVADIDRALELIRRHGGAIRIEQIARLLGISRRQLERRFRDHVGLTPKDVSRIGRVHAALRMVESAPHAGGAEIAAMCGFSDQAHLIHECRAIAGVTPARFSSSGASLASLMREL